MAEIGEIVSYALYYRIEAGVNDQRRRAGISQLVADLSLPVGRIEGAGHAAHSAGSEECDLILHTVGKEKSDTVSLREAKRQQSIGKLRDLLVPLPVRKCPFA